MGNRHFSELYFFLVNRGRYLFIGLSCVFFLSVICSCRDKKDKMDKDFIPIDDVYFYKDFPPIKGYTSTQTGEGPALFTVSIILIYPAKNRRITPEIGKRRLVIVDKVRNQLERFPESAFLGDNFEKIKKVITREINKILVNGQIISVLVDTVDIYPVPEEFK